MTKTVVTLEDGKYRLEFDKGGLRALRYGEPWQDLTGNNLVLAMMQRIEALEEEVALGSIKGLREALGIAESHAELHDASPTTGSANDHGWRSACNGIAGALRKCIERATAKKGSGA